MRAAKQELLAAACAAKLQHGSINLELHGQAQQQSRPRPTTPPGPALGSSLYATVLV
jgi:hypothetical protein